MRTIFINLELVETRVLQDWSFLGQGTPVFSYAAAIRFG